MHQVQVTVEGVETRNEQYESAMLKLEDCGRDGGAGLANGL